MARGKVLVIDTDSPVYAVGFMSQRKRHFATHKGKIVKECKLDATEKEIEQGICRTKIHLNKWAKTQTDYPVDEIEFDYEELSEGANKCIQSMKNYIEDLFRFSGCDRYIVLLTKGGNDFRSRMATIWRYKGNRLAMDKPIHYNALRRYLRSKEDALIYAKWEADDAACMVMNKGKDKDGNTYVLAAIDKDLNQVMGARIDPNKRDEGVFFIDEWDAWFSFYCQMLSGDKADNIKGLSGTREAPGIGDTKAKNLLKNCETPEEMCQVVIDQYKHKYGEKPFKHIPWWWDDELCLKDDGLAAEYRKKGHPFYKRKKSFTYTWVDMFRENADLLYMLRTPDDQYVPHVEIKGWKSYDSGIVKHFLGDK